MINNGNGMVTLPERNVRPKTAEAAAAAGTDGTNISNHTMRDDDSASSIVAGN